MMLVRNKATDVIVEVHELVIMQLPDGMPIVGIMTETPDQRMVVPALQFLKDHEPYLSTEGHVTAEELNEGYQQ